MKRIRSVGTVSEFIHLRDSDKKEYEILSKLKAHLDRHHIAYKVAGTLIIITVAGGIDFASTAEAASNIDKAVMPLYQKLVNLGKWVIIFKGGSATIKAIGQGDIPAVQKNLISYVLVYLVLLGLPWCLDQAEDVFGDMERGL
jgi:hypothetical protein